MPANLPTSYRTMNLRDLESLQGLGCNVLRALQLLRPLRDSRSHSCQLLKPRSRDNYKFCARNACLTFELASFLFESRSFLANSTSSSASNARLALRYTQTAIIRDKNELSELHDGKFQLINPGQKAFHPGQSYKIRDCPGHSGTVGNYASMYIQYACSTIIIMSIYWE